MVENGGNFSMVCNVEGNPHPTLTWYRNGLSLDDTITNEQKQRGGFDYAPHWRYRDDGTKYGTLLKTLKLKVLSINCPRLEIVDISYEQLSGVYACVAKNKVGELEIYATVSLEEGTNHALLIGLTVSVVVICLLSGVCIYYFYNKWKQTEAKLSPKDIEELKRGDPARWVTCQREN